MEYILLATLIAGFYVGWNIGSNDAANAMGAPVGGRIISYRQAISIMVLFVLLGAVLEGWKVMETVGTGIVISPGGVNPLTTVPEIAIIALFAAGAWVTIASTFRLPVSTSQSIVGSVIGAGLLLSFLDLSEVPSTSVKFGVLKSIGLAWVLTPIAAAVFAYVIYHVASPGLRKIGSAVTLNRVLGILVVSTGAFTAYSLGANDVGNATALIFAVTEGSVGGMIWTPRLIGLFGGIALAVGALTYSRGVMKTVGRGITNLNAVTAFAAQFGAASTVWMFTQFGLPVSTSQAIVGGVAGAGLVKGTATVSKGKLGEIGVAWVLTPTVSAALTFGAGWILLGG
ncbi:hypothetical protein AKJ53_00035 [candidate division MSBL1 archaeon SCGC-AAA382F02]|uniref:Phosphate permease n=1 Tax=candidate division MSBL1 archaeon SCGC-AAA382F02 TaxID=1698282 RepID=A0A133VJ84_9EURY|nr:hypothetical protein AKJ53_00035 [candidate division MSBL1 archaeon SCGC-AAA382F02]